VETEAIHRWHTKLLCVEAKSEGWRRDDVEPVSRMREGEGIKGSLESRCSGNKHGIVGDLFDVM
jgi:hypothetical protein